MEFATGVSYCAYDSRLCVCVFARSRVKVYRPLWRRRSRRSGSGWTPSSHVRDVVAARRHRSGEWQELFLRHLAFRVVPLLLLLTGVYTHTKQCAAWLSKNTCASLARPLARLHITAICMNGSATAAAAHPVCAACSGSSSNSLSKLNKTWRATRQHYYRRDNIRARVRHKDFSNLRGGPVRVSYTYPLNLARSKFVEIYSFPRREDSRVRVHALYSTKRTHYLVQEKCTIFFTACYCSLVHPILTLFYGLHPMRTLAREQLARTQCSQFT
ncbi:unnamed protein product [Trichogramma brassicae]|uniref:Uncharacterized protein n=1 Tax=Trichogramma brassicae TaxID=86971 RepID=A0A6H5IH35_9HYME|nr:unnamed protein product [Trichogramma brassicae]